MQVEHDSHGPAQRRRRWLWRGVGVVAVTMLLTGIGVALSGPPCDTFSTVSIDYAAIDGPGGAPFEEAVLHGLRIGAYVREHPDMGEDDVLRVLSEPTPGKDARVTLDIEGEPEVSLSWHGDGWLADGVYNVSTC